MNPVDTGGSFDYNGCVISPEISGKIENEILAAEQARSEGNEGRARVCARRAAGLAIQAYYRARGDSLVESNAYSLLRRFQTDVSIPQEWKRITDTLLTRVEKDYSFPSRADVLAETRRLIQQIDAALKGTQLD